MRRFFRSLAQQLLPYPPEHRWNFINLYLDISWWGVINGTTVAFLAVYLSRLGASTFQLGLLTAIPALVNTVVTLPANLIMQGRPTHRVLRWSSLIWRLGYGLLIPLPFLLAARAQIWVILGITLAMNIPATIAVVMGNTFFAEVVPDEWRGTVAGMRNALMALVTMLATLTAGQILTRLSFQTGYQVVFILGLVGALMSLLHLSLVRPALLGPGSLPAARIRPSLRGLLRLDVCRGSFGRVLLLIFLFNAAVLLSGPILPIYQVRVLNQTDRIISIGASIFWVTNFLGSLRAGGLARRLGFRRVTGIGTLIISAIIGLFIFSFRPAVFYLVQFLSGIGWALIGSSVINYVLENAPCDDRPAHLAWYNLAVNGATLVSALAGPWISNYIGLAGTLGLSSGLRFLAGIAILILHEKGVQSAACA